MIRMPSDADAVIAKAHEMALSNAEKTAVLHLFLLILPPILCLLRHTFLLFYRIPLRSVKNFRKLAEKTASRDDRSAEYYGMML